MFDCHDAHFDTKYQLMYDEFGTLIAKQPK
jgi:hypothetical protein